jgi:putative nucleotidyltransferase with HDIG domain
MNYNRIISSGFIIYGGSKTVTKKIRIENLSVGQFVTEAYNPDGKLLFSNFTVSDHEDIKRLKDLGARICHVRDSTQSESTENLTAEDSSEANLTANEIINNEINDLSSLIEKTEATYQKTLDQTETLFESIYSGDARPEELHQLEPFVDKFMDFMDESPSSISVLTQIKRHDKTTFDHSINVAILSLVYANHVGFQREEIFKLGFGALLHDIGKKEISREIIQKPDDLTEKEWNVIQRHPEKGKTLLEQGGFDEAVVRIAHEHHEKPDGAGYPNGKSEISKYARIVSVIDAFEALTADRPYREPMNPLKAYEILQKEFNGYDETRPIFQSLIQCMGLFPVGCVVRLTNGDLAVVKENHPSNLKAPRVKIINIPKMGRVENPYDVDLNQIQQQKKIVNDRVYDESIEIKKVLNISKIPELRKTVPELIQPVL